MAMLEDGPGLWVLLGQGRSRYLHLLLPRDAHLACPGWPHVPSWTLPSDNQPGPLQCIQLQFKVETFQRALGCFFPLPSFFLCKQLITSLKGSSSPPCLPRSLEAVNIKQLSAGIKLHILFCLKLRQLLFGGCLVVFFFYFIFGVKCIIGVLYSCLDNELSGYLQANLHYMDDHPEEKLLCLFMLQCNLYYSCPPEKTSVKMKVRTGSRL